MKPGYQSFEVWLSFLVAALGAVASSGLLVGVNPNIGLGVSLMSVLAITFQRAFLKNSTNANPVLRPTAEPVLPEAKALMEQLQKTIPGYKPDIMEGEKTPTKS